MSKEMLKKINQIATKSYKFFIALVAIVFVLLCIMIIYICNRKYTTKTMVANEPLVRKNAQIVSNQEDERIEQLKKIIAENTKDSVKEELYVEEKDLEFTTRYEQSDKIATGTMQVIQDGIDGKQNITKKRTYINDELVSDEPVGSQILKSSVEKIVKIGTGPTYLKYTVSKDDKMYVTSSILAIRQEANEQSNKIITINENDEVTVLEINDAWYKIKYGNYIGWAKADCLTKINPNQESIDTSKDATYTKAQLLNTLSFNMALNKPSGLSLSQFERIFANESKDSKGVFKENAKYFYYAEKQYNINGVFLAAVAVHESNWGTSAMTQNKKNLFGYGAYDRNPSDNAYSFSSYAEGIDLLARVFAKYYLNPSGTKIYNGEIATGNHYNGPTLSGVNKKYASDNNWSNAVYKWMQYLYNKFFSY